MASQGGRQDLLRPAHAAVIARLDKLFDLVDETTRRRSESAAAIPSQRAPMELR